MNQTNKADTIAMLRTQHPDWTLAIIGAEVGVTHEYVRQVLSARGLRTKAVRAPFVGSRRPKEKKPPIPTVTWSNSGEIALGKGDIGTITELLVCADLVRMGHDIYRAVNHSSPADLIVFANGRAYRVEVKSAQMKGNCVASGIGAVEKYDILARVLPDGKIFYLPALPICKIKTRSND